MGDIATNFFFQSMILYQTRFYTDTAGLSAGAVGYDVSRAPAGRCHLRSVRRRASPTAREPAGESSGRGFSLTAVPFGLIFWLVYVTPNFGAERKADLRLHHLRAGDDDVLGQQHAVFGADGRDDAGLPANAAVSRVIDLSAR